jgi:hypothetical protein
LTAEELAEFKGFLATLASPPNPFRKPDNSLPTRVELPGHFAMGRDQRTRGSQLPAGNAQRGLAQFLRPAVFAADSSGCVECHTLPTGLSPHLRFVGGRWQSITPGTNGAAHLALVTLERSGELPFKVPTLRTLTDKFGFDPSSTSGLSGFGFMHAGNIGTLSKFLADGFDFRTDQLMADMIAFLLAFNGSDLPAGLSNDIQRPPGISSRDSHAAAGRQFILTNSAVPVMLEQLVGIANSATSRVEVIVRQYSGGRTAGWRYRGANIRRFFPNLESETPVTFSELLALATPEGPLVFTVVPRRTAERLAQDRDEDGALDQSEILAGSDPADPSSTPETIAPLVLEVRWSPGETPGLEFVWSSFPGGRYQLQTRPSLDAGTWTDLAEVEATDPRTVVLRSLETSQSAGYYRIVRKPSP